jgi:hypothetical protein
MEKLRLDLQALEVERLDVGATALVNDVEHMNMGHGLTELGASCGADNPENTYCSGATCYSCSSGG